MNGIWIPCNLFLPDNLVTTVNGAVRIDRFIDGQWGACMPHVKNKGRYRPHVAWAYLPKPYKADRKE